MLSVTATPVVSYTSAYSWKRCCLCKPGALDAPLLGKDVWLQGIGVANWIACNHRRLLCPPSNAAFSLLSSPFPHCLVRCGLCCDPMECDKQPLVCMPGGPCCVWGTREVVIGQWNPVRSGSCERAVTFVQG